MSTLDRLEKLEGMTVNSHNFELFAEIKADIQKLLAVVELGKDLRNHEIYANGEESVKVLKEFFEALAEVEK